MRRPGCRSRSLLLLLPLLVAAPAAQAITIQFIATDLTDAVMGEDLWHYEFQLSDFDFDTDEGFSILFDPALYAMLENPPPPVNADWLPSTLQPDVGLPSAGRYEAIAQVDAPSLADSFGVDFAYLGSGTPGPQTFLVFDSSFVPVDGGTTVPVPEPGTAVLLMLGLVGLRAARRAR